jgi:ADP-heptose:LPS heptosyltransferase
MGLANLRVLSAFKDFDPAQAARQCVQALAAQDLVAAARSEVVLMPGGGAGDYKRWPIEHYVALADLLKATLMPEARFCFVLGPDEAKQYRWLQSLARSDFVYLMTQPVAAIAKAVLNAQLVVANDCGPSHLAQFARVPYVGIFHESNREWFWARDNSLDVVPVDGTTDIKHVTPAQVLAAAQSVLSVARA